MVKLSTSGYRLKFVRKVGHYLCDPILGSNGFKEAHFKGNRCLGEDD